MQSNSLLHVIYNDILAKVWMVSQQQLHPPIQNFHLQSNLIWKHIKSYAI